MSNNSIQSVDLLDSAAITELHDMLGDDLLEIVEQFVDQLEEHIAAIEAAFVASDAVALTAAAHALKGSAGNIGVTRLSALCSEIERAARVQKLDEAATLRAELAPVAAASRKALCDGGFDRRGV